MVHKEALVHLVHGRFVIQRRQENLYLEEHSRGPHRQRREWSRGRQAKFRFVSRRRRPQSSRLVESECALNRSCHWLRSAMNGERGDSSGRFRSYGACPFLPFAVSRPDQYRSHTQPGLAMAAQDRTAVRLSSAARDSFSVTTGAGGSSRADTHQTAIAIAELVSVLRVRPDFETWVTPARRGRAGRHPKTGDPQKPPQSAGRAAMT